MNNIQQKHLLTRIQKLAATRLREIQQEVTDKGVTLDDQSRLKIVRESGHCPWRAHLKTSDCGVHQALQILFDFSPWEREETFDREAFEKRQKLIQARLDTLCDQVVLSTVEASEALTLLTNFHKFVSEA